VALRNRPFRSIDRFYDQLPAVESPFLILKAANRLPTPPSVAVRILEMVENEATTIADVTQIIASDPALTAKIMKFIGSPMMGLGFRGTTVAEAVARIGMRGTQMMALSFSLVSQKHRTSCPTFNFDTFWSESLGRAVAARTLAAHLRGWDPEEAFVTGLLARIGQLVLATGLAQKYDPVLRGLVHPRMSLEDRERTVFGYDHLEMGKQLLREWHLPEVVWKTTGQLASGQERENRSARVIEVADVIARFLVDDTRHTPVAVHSLSALARDRLEIDPAGFRPLLGEIGQDWISYGSLLMVPTNRLPEIDQIEARAEEHRTTLRVASELEVQTLKAENKELGRLARRDRLTGLLNRAAFDEELAAMIELAEQSLQPLALLLVDADHFKAVNHAHGHRTGDDVLMHLARVLEDHLRERDRIFRFEGGTFAVLAPDCVPQAATDLAETLRSTVERHPYAAADASISITVCVGIGIAHWPGTPRPAAGLIDFAEDRLYDAKRAGRNRWRLRPGSGGSGWWRRLGGLLNRNPRSARGGR